MALTTLLPPRMGVGGTGLQCVEARAGHGQAQLQLPSFPLRSGPHPVSMKYTTDDLTPSSSHIRAVALGEHPEGVQGWATLKPQTVGALHLPRPAESPHGTPPGRGRGHLHLLEKTPGISSHPFVS